jgi:glycosyltransferase involved in cell wall biosynthesis
MMRIAFADFGRWDYHVQTVDTSPMGGSQSAACYLARALARLGHEVFLITLLSTPGVYDGVTCLSGPKMSGGDFAALRCDAFICVNGAGQPLLKLRETLGTQTRLILWNQHATDQPAAQVLQDPAQRKAYDGVAMVSEWQRGEFLKLYGLNPKTTGVLRNGIAPAFANQFADAEPILPQKAWPPIIAYTSTPFRGLDLLLDAFPGIRQRVPGTRLQVFSSMQVYHVDAAKDQALYGAFYQRCRTTEGVEYVGSRPQPELARAMRDVMLLAYPNTFAETSCIVVIEAMASGCRVVTSARGALPETTAGFARLVPVDQSDEGYLKQFTDEVVDSLMESHDRPGECEQFLRRQVEYANTTATWATRAVEWVEWLKQLLPRV